MPTSRAFGLDATMPDEWEHGSPDEAWVHADRRADHGLPNVAAVALLVALVTMIAMFGVTDPSLIHLEVPCVSP